MRITVRVVVEPDAGVGEIVRETVFANLQFPKYAYSTDVWRTSKAGGKVARAMFDSIAAQIDSELMQNGESDED